MSWAPVRRLSATLSRRRSGLRAVAELRALADEHAALRRVAECVARGASEPEVFGAVAVEAAGLIQEATTLVRIGDARTYTVVALHGGPAPVGTRVEVPEDDEGVVAEILRTGRPAGRDGYGPRQGRACARGDYGIWSGVGVPIVVDGRIWGVLGATTTDGRRLPAGCEQRLARFAELVTATVATAQARADLQRLVDERTALRGLAELVARSGPPQEVFAAAAAAASALLDGAAMTLTRFDGPRHLVVVAAHGGPAPVGASIPYEPDTLPDRVRVRGRVDRVDDYTVERDAGLAARFGLAAAVAAPILVAGAVWGMLTATSAAHPLPAGTEDRLQQFAEVAAAALANSQARADVQALADDQAALRHVAELAARDAPVEQVLDAVATQAARLAGVEFTTVLRYHAGGATEIVALDGGPDGIVVGMRAPGTGEGAVQRVHRTGRGARIDDLAAMTGHWPRVAHASGYSASVAVPILIAGALWGALVVVGRDGPLPPAIEDHLANFAELAGAAISAAQARQELRALADEQAALRRVAELVARGAALDEVFAAVAIEASHLLGDLAAVLLRYDPGDVAVAVAVSASTVPLGLRVPSHPGTPTGVLLRTSGPVRVDRFADTALADIARELGVGAGVAVPVAIEGRVWGALTTSTAGLPLPAGTEDRLAQLADLTAAAIANTENKAKLTASRARVVATADETRRRLQRDVHDSAQQRLVHTIIALKLARDAIAGGDSGGDLVVEALANAERANSELRDVVRGILPASLTRGGLRIGLESLAVDLALPVDVRVAAPRLPAPLETTAYFVVAEALANVVKHADASRATVGVAIEGGSLAVEVRDDGSGGADPARGTGLLGLLDRVEASEGTLSIVSPAGAGTTLRATLPLAGTGGDALPPRAEQVAAPIHLPVEDRGPPRGVVDHDDRSGERRPS